MAKESREKTRQGQQQPYDNLLKSLLEGQEQQILPYLLEGAQYLRTLNVEAIRNPLRVDRAYLVYYEGRNIFCISSSKADQTIRWPRVY